MTDGRYTWKRELTLPNVVTLCRLALAPFVFHALVSGHPREALILFAVAALTDGLDGFLARRYGWMSRSGAYLDPIADKVLLSGIFLSLAFAGQAPRWFVALVFGRDLLIVAGVAVALAWTQQRKFPPSQWGKLSTFLQVLAAIVFLVRAAVPGTAMEGISNVVLWPSAAATVWSGVHYSWRGLRLLLDH